MCSRVRGPAISVPVDLVPSTARSDTSSLCRPDCDVIEGRDDDVVEVRGDDVIDMSSTE